MMHVYPRLVFASVVFATAFTTRSFYLEDLLNQARAQKKHATFLDAIREVTFKFSFDYEERALAILDGKGVLEVSHPPRELEIAHPPGYEAFIAGVYSVAPRRLRSVTSAQILLDSLCAALICVAVGGLFRPSIGFIGGMLIALSPHLAFNSLVPMPDTPSVWPLVAAFLLLPRALAVGRWPLFVAMGVLIGVSCWLRGNALLLTFVAAALIYVLRPRLGFRGPVLVAASTCLLILPITIRNYVVFDIFLPLGWGAGRTMIEGIADYDFENRFGFPKFDRDITKWDDETITSHLARETLLEKKAMGVILRHPFWFASVVVRRALFQWSYDTWSPEPLDTPFHTRIQAPVSGEGSGRWLRATVRSLQQGYSTWLGRSLSVLGVIWLVVLRRRDEVVALTIVPVYFFVFQSLLHTEYRYCLAIHYFLFPLMGAGVVESVAFLARLAKRRKKA